MFRNKDYWIEQWCNLKIFTPSLSKMAGCQGEIADTFYRQLFLSVTIILVRRHLQWNITRYRGAYKTGQSSDLLTSFWNGWRYFHTPLKQTSNIMVWEVYNWYLNQLKYIKLIQYFFEYYIYIYICRICRVCQLRLIYYSFS